VTPDQLATLLARDESKTLEFKVDCSSLSGIVRTAVAFANTAGGTIVVGVEDRTRAVVGLVDVLAQEERLASAFADRVRPLLVPDIAVRTWRGRDLIVVSVPHTAAPFHLAREGVHDGVYVRLGSTNRRAGPEMIAELQRLATNTSFDELPCAEADSEDIDFRVASELFAERGRQLTAAKRRSLGLMVGARGSERPSRAAVLIFGRDRRRFFPEATIRCARFAGSSTSEIADQTEIDVPLPQAVEEAVHFIERHTRQGIDIGRMFDASAASGLRPPDLREIGTSFRVTLHSAPAAVSHLPAWHADLLAALSAAPTISTREATLLWGVSDRAARTRLRQLVERGVLAEIGTGPHDPRRVYVLRGRGASR
jgi:predicted HTH transcriptional regulator